jgi:hypothetical protein
MKSKQLSFEFPYRSNADGVVKLEQFLKQNLLEIEKIFPRDYKWEIQKLKRDREDKDYRKEIYCRTKAYENHVTPHPFDCAMQNIKGEVDQAIDDALGARVTKKNYDNVMGLIKEETEVLRKILDTQVYNEETGWVPSDNVWLYHFIRARPAIPQILRLHEKPEYLKI